MIWYFPIQFVITLFGIILTELHIPVITALPTIVGVNLDTTMQQAVSYFHELTITMWYLGDVWTGALLLMGYYALKMALRLLLGARAPS